MRVSDLKTSVGKVVGVDLVNGNRLTARLDSVTADGYAVLKNPLIFVPTPTGQVAPVLYGAPLYEHGKELVIDANHIVMLLTCPEKMVEAYTRLTGSVITEADAAPKLILPT